MSDDKSQLLKEQTDRLKVVENAFDNTIKTKQTNAQLDADNIANLKNQKSKISYIREMCSGLSEDSINKIGQDDFDKIMFVIKRTGVSSQYIFLMQYESELSNKRNQNHSTLVNSLSPTIESLSASLNILDKSHVNLFPDSKTISNKYESEDNFNQHINAIREQLEIHFPEIKIEFDVLMQKYNIFKSDKTQYFDLVAARSLFFFKMIFLFSMQKFNITESDRRKQIEKFVFGNNDIDNAVSGVLENTHLLYKELSKQGEKNASVKYGKINPEDAELLFVQLIGNMASILKLRKQYFK